PPFKHVVYIIKENRTYDQIFGGLEEGDGDPRLLFFGTDSTPNHRALARRFGLFDRFFTNAEVSSQGHLWSTAAYVPDYAEKTVPSLYSNRRADVDGDEAAEPAPAGRSHRRRESEVPDAARLHGGQRPGARADHRGALAIAVLAGHRGLRPGGRRAGRSRSRRLAPLAFAGDLRLEPAGDD